MDALDYLFGLEFHGIKLGLNNITDLLNAVGDPQNHYPTVHVGGTNGKGSTVAFLDHILREAGYRVGRFTSPHLISLNERFMIDGSPIDDSDLESLIDSFRLHAERVNLSPTFFEMNTAITFQYFADQKVDIALIEVGLGGRFDSTNVIIPELSIVTNINLEHTQFLGDTHEAIAFEKGGIIKPGVPVVLGNLGDAEGIVLRGIADKQNSVKVELGVDFFMNTTEHVGQYDIRGSYWNIEGVSLPLSGEHQAENATVAFAAAELLSVGFKKLNSRVAATGLTNTQWPCRMETVLDSPEVIIDVAHNPAGAETLVDALGRDAIMIVSVAEDKESAIMISSLSRCAKHIFLTRFDGARSVDPNFLAQHVPSGVANTVVEDFNGAIDAGITMAERKGYPLLITGSLFTAGQARAYLIEKYDAPAMKF